MDVELANMSWKIKWDDLLFKGVGKSMEVSLRSISNNVSFKLLFLITIPHDYLHGNSVLTLLKQMKFSLY